MSELFHLIYISRAVQSIADRDIHDILEVSRSRNAKAGVTGLLLYAGEGFIQVLEGKEEAVEKIFASIEGDWRHRAPIALVREPIEARAFSNWSMGFERLQNGVPANVKDVFVLSPSAITKVTAHSSEIIKSFIRSFVDLAAR